MEGWEFTRAAEAGDLVKVQELARQVSEFAREEALREAARGVTWTSCGYSQSNTQSM